MDEIIMKTIGMNRKSFWLM